MPAMFYGIILMVMLPASEPVPVPAIPFAPYSYVCYRTDVPLKIDGRLEEHAWQMAPQTELFHDISGPAFPKPRHATHAKILWDDHYLYFAAQLEEPHVWAKLRKRDSVIFYDNDFEIFIDPDGDTYDYYELEVNAFATEWDLFLPRPYRDGGPALHAWDITGLRTGVHIQGTLNNPADTDKGWSVEIAMPWEMLKEAAPEGEAPQAGDYWRMNFSRVQWKTRVEDGDYVKIINPETGKPLPEDNWVWSPQGLINMHYPEMWGFVKFSDTISGKGKDQFQMPAVEHAKWVWRQIYYSQRNLASEGKPFINDLKKLLPADVKPVSGYSWPPKIKLAGPAFVASLNSKADGKMLYIDQTGRIR